MDPWGYPLAKGFPVADQRRRVHKAFTFTSYIARVKTSLRRFSLALALVAGVALPTAAAGAGPATWNVDAAHSLATFSATHFFFTHVHGTIPIKHATIKMTQGSSIPSSAEAALDPGGLDTANGGRDNDLRSPHFFESKTYPAMSFESTKIAATDERHFTMQGNLTMHGATHAVTLNAQVISHNKDRVTFSAQGSIDRRDWGMNYGAPVVSNNIDIQLQIEAVKE